MARGLETREVTRGRFVPVDKDAFKREGLAGLILLKTEDPTQCCSLSV